MSGYSISQRLALCGMPRTSSSSDGTRLASTKRLLDTGADDARDDHETKRHNSDDTVLMAQ